MLAEGFRNAGLDDAGLLSSYPRDSHEALVAEGCIGASEVVAGTLDLTATMSVDLDGGYGLYLQFPNVASIFPSLLFCSSSSLPLSLPSFLLSFIRCLWRSSARACWSSSKGAEAEQCRSRIELEVGRSKHRRLTKSASQGRVDE